MARGAGIVSSLRTGKVRKRVERGLKWLKVIVFHLFG